MKCPHCLVAFHESLKSGQVGFYEKLNWHTLAMECPECKRAVIFLQGVHGSSNVIHEFLAYPKGISRSPVPPEVPPQYAGDYKEACLVLADSEKASAALSRRCLQAILRDVAKTKQHDLSKQIDEVLGSNTLPSHLARAIDAIRNVGNFAAHPQKDTNTGAIVDVEPGEAEWCLEVLEGLFDFYFVQPAVLAAKKQALNAKLQAAGKPAMK